MLIDFRERGREGEKEGEVHPCDWLPLACALTEEDLTHDSGMCPDQESTHDL